MDTNNDKLDNPATIKKHDLIFPTLSLVVAIIAALVLVAAGLGTRIGLWNFRTGFTILGYGGYSGVIAVLAALAGIAASIRKKSFLGGIIAFLALVVGVTVFALPLSWKLSAQRLPRIHDITTDITNPPGFVAVLPLRKDAPNSAQYGGPEVAAKQLQAYPDIKTLVLSLPADQAFALALDTANKMGWTIDATAPEEGRIEATDTTFWFGFKDDIVIRITPAGDRSLVDVRSESRVGISDVGTNAKRIRAFLKRLEGRG